MIAHVSMPADDCEHVARVLAEMTEGQALRFPPGGPTAWNVWSKHNDFQIVVTPRGHMIVEGERESVLVDRGGHERTSETHFAVGVDRPAADIVAIARAQGWSARVCARADFFDVVEVWVENAYLVEVLDPSQLAAYERSMTVERWKCAFGL